MFKDGVLTIDHDTWKAGIAASPFVGCGDLRNADIFGKPGVLQCGFKATKETGDILTDFARFMRHDESNDLVYAGDASGRLYSRSSGGTWGPVEVGGLEPFNVSVADECLGLELWKGCILYADATKLHVWEIGATNVDDDWQTFEEGQRNLIDLPHVMHIGQDDVVYITDGRYIASLQEQSGQTFDPDDAGTYTWNATALDLPDGYVASTISELGTYLVIGTYFTEVLNRGNRAELFPWNRTSPSFNIPLRTKGNGVWQTIAQGNVLFSIVDRRNAKLYASNLTLLELQREVRRIDAELTLHPDAIDIFDEEILVGLGDGNAANLGLYSFKEVSIDGDAVQVMQLRNVLSEGDEDVEIGSVLTIDDGKILASWKRGAFFGVDVISTTRYTGYATVLETPLYTVGTVLNPHSFTQIDILLGKKLAAGQGVRVSYREGIDEDFVLMGTYDFATWGAEAHINAESALDGLRKVQLKIELTSAEDSDDSPQLLSVSLF